MTCASARPSVNETSADCSLVDAFLVINRGRQTGAKHNNVLRGAGYSMQVLENSR
jgi:hypothetical protein